MQEGKQMEGLKLVSSQFRNSNVWHTGLPAAGPICPSLPWCFSFAGGPLTGAVQRTQASWEAAVQEGKQMEGLKLVSGQCRKKRLPLWARPRARSVLHSHGVFNPAGGPFDRSCAGRKPATKGRKQVGRWHCRKASKWKV